MRELTGYKEAKAFGEFTPLPKGNYIVKILAVKEAETRSHAPMLEVSFDIVEGEHKEYYRNDYKANASTEKKWRGIYNIFLPLEDGSERDGWTMSALKRDIMAIEDSNTGYHWNWDESKLKDKIVGAKFRFEEYKKTDGEIGHAVRCCQFCPAASVRDGSASPAKDKLLSASTRPTTASSTEDNGFITLPDDDLPF